MFFSEGQSCPVCKQAFQKNDDIVVCPVCGAPHHRSCYNETGHCFFESDHGTEAQWSREKAVKAEPPKPTEKPVARRCPHCGFDNPQFAEFCGHCGRPISDASGQDTQNETYKNTQFPSPGAFREVTYVPFRAPVQNTGGVAPNATVDGETVADMARVVGRNESYYVPYFVNSEKEGSSFKWNWAAFLFAPFWLLYRKCYLVGGLTLLFSLLQQAVISIITVTRFGDLIAEGDSYFDAMQKMQDAMASDPSIMRYLWFVTLLVLVSGALHLFFGFFGNTIYKQSCLHKIRSAKKKYDNEYTDMLSVIGGVSVGLSLLSYLAWYILPAVFTALL